jgi:hypothetical protein
MTAIPDAFRAFVAEKVGDRVDRGVRLFGAADLPEGDVEVRVVWSSVNYKDALATIANGKVARISPLIPGIDLAGEVVASEDRSIDVGSLVLAHGYELGVSRHGGYGEYARVPAGWVVPLPEGLSLRESMAIGTAGFTAACSVALLEGRGLVPAAGPVLVTGATGGVGRTAIAILVERGTRCGRSPEARGPRRAARLGSPGSWRDEVAAEADRWSGALGRGGRLGGGGDAAVHPAYAPVRRCGRGQRQRERPGARDDSLPVHPPGRRAPRRRLRRGSDRRAAAAVAAPGRRPPAEGAR